MERFFENMKSLQDLLSRFHEGLDFATQQWRMIMSYLFICEYPIPDFVSYEQRRTLEYLKDIVKEKRYREIKDLLRYFDVKVLEAENDLNEMLKESESKTLLDNHKSVFISMKNTDLEEIEKRDGLLFWRRMFARLSNTSSFPLRASQHPYLDASKYLESDRPLKFDSFFYEGSYSCITKIHANHFIDDESIMVLLNRNERYPFIRELRSLDNIDSLICRHNHLEVENEWRSKSLIFNFNNACEIFNDAFINKYTCHYDFLINQLSKETPIYDSAFKMQLTQWMLYFKIKSSPMPEGSCQVIGLLQNQRNEYFNIFFETFEKLTKYFYDYLSNRDWIILKSPKGHSWLTTEDPGFSIDLNAFISPNKPLEPDTDLTNIERDSVLYFPLSKDYCLRVQSKLDNEIEVDGKAAPIQFKESTDIEFKTINTLTVSTNKEVLISADKETLEQFACAE